MSNTYYKKYGYNTLEVINQYGNILGRIIGDQFLPEPFVPLSYPELKEITDELKRKVGDNNEIDS